MGTNPLVKEDYNLCSNFTLSKEQQEGVGFMLTHFNSFCAFKPGLGKTITVLTTLQHIFNYNSKVCAVIICPKAATTAFINEMTKRFRLPISVNTTEIKQNQRGARVFLFNYSNLAPLENFMENAKRAGVKVVGVFDECHTLGNPTNKAYKILMGMRKDFCTVYGVSATLFLNDVEALYHLTQFIRPGFFGSLINFRNNFMIFKDKKLRIKGRTRIIKECVGFKNLDILRSQIEQIAIIRGIKYDFNLNVVPVNLTQVEQDEYFRAAKGLFNVDEDADEKTFSARMHDLQRVIDGTSLTDTSFIPSKVQKLLELCKEICSRDENLIIYTDYVETYNFIKHYLEHNKRHIGYEKIFIIAGEVSDKERRRAETETTKRCITIITKAGCQSINLQANNNMIFFNLPWSIGATIQAFGRILRMDSKYSSQNFYIIEATNTIDTYRRLMFESHRDLFNAVFGSDPNLPSLVGGMDAQDIIKMKSYFKNKLMWRR